MSALNTPKVSIIMPAYNVGGFISNAIDSVLGQTLKKIELIIINDGSSDSTSEIINQYRMKDNRIIVINQDNQGVSSARNAGLNIATGEYIGFVDSDDWIEPQMYETLYNVAKKEECEIAFCNYIVNNSCGMRDYSVGLKRFGSFKPNMKIAYSDINNKIYNLPMHMKGAFWCHIYKREIIDKNNIKFNPTLPFGEDILFNISVFLKAENFIYIPKHLYNYCVRSQSAMTKYNESMFEKYLIFISEVEEILKKYQIKGKEYQPVASSILIHVHESIVNEFKPINKKGIFQKFYTVTKIVNNKKVQELAKNSNVKAMNGIGKYICLMFKYQISIGLVMLALYSNYIVPIKLRWRKKLKPIS